MKLSEQLNQLSNQQLSTLLALLEKDGGSAQPSRTNINQPAQRNVLVAYYLPESYPPAASDTACECVNGLEEQLLRDYCRERLPAQHCPTRFVALNRFPTLPNGKLAHAQLPVPGLRDREDPAVTESDSGVALQLIALLGDILCMDDVRTSDNFFEIGGDSITAIQFISKARDAGLQIDVAAVSQSGSIAEMATHCTVVSRVALPEGVISEVDQQSQPAKFAASGLDDNELDDFLQAFD